MKDNLLFSTFIFILVVILRLIIFKVQDKKKNKSVEVYYLNYRFNLDIDKMNKKSIKMSISILDALVISISIFASLTITSKMLLVPIIGLVFIFILIFILNEILGRILLLKGYESKKKKER